MGKQHANLLPHYGEVFLYDDFLDASKADEFFLTLLSGISWQQHPVKMFGREVMQPRLTFSFADPGIVYGYSGLTLISTPWSAPVTVLRTLVQEKTGHVFNTALLNLYRDGRDYMGWHRDNEAALGSNPVIASVSLGAERTFQMREYATRSNLVSVNLPHGSLLVMGGESQHRWEHRLPKNGRVVSPRVNITFRNVR
jgi:alkylated DNA repair dioxygenase AlkB